LAWPWWPPWPRLHGGRARVENRGGAAVGLFLPLASLKVSPGAPFRKGASLEAGGDRDEKGAFGCGGSGGGPLFGPGVDYRQEAVAAMALARLQTVAQGATGEEKLLAWAKEVKARAEKSYGAKEAFKAAREAQAALALFRAAQVEPPRQGWAPGPRHGFHGAPGRPGMGMRQGRPFWR
jgi:hypothetical protein